MAESTGRKRVLRGTVTSAAGQKTITIQVERQFAHPVYGKMVRRHRKFAAHDERGEAGVGDVVEVLECRPISKTKRFRLVRIVEKSPGLTPTIAPSEEAAALEQA